MKREEKTNSFSKLLIAVFIILNSATGMVGCASQKRISPQQSQIDNLKRELRFLKEHNSQLRRELADLQKRISEQELTIRQSRADLASQMLEVSQQLEAVQNQLKDTNYRITALRQRGGSIATLRSSPGMTPEPDTSDTAQQPPSQSFGLDQSREIYNTAYRDVLRGNYQLALHGFRQFIQLYPNSELTDNAQYWVGEVYYAQGRFPNAIEEFEKVIKWHPNSDKVSSALLKIGYSYINIDEVEQGKLYLEEVITDHPDSQEASLAKGRLAALK